MSNVGTPNKLICEGCGQRIKPRALAVARGQTFHKRCFRCAECKTILKEDSFHALGRIFFCPEHPSLIPANLMQATEESAKRPSTMPRSRGRRRSNKDKDKDPRPPHGSAPTTPRGSRQHQSAPSSPKRRGKSPKSRRKSSKTRSSRSKGFRGKTAPCPINLRGGVGGDSTDTPPQSPQSKRRRSGSKSRRKSGSPKQRRGRRKSAPAIRRDLASPSGRSSIPLLSTTPPTNVSNILHDIEDKYKMMSETFARRGTDSPSGTGGHKRLHRRSSSRSRKKGSLSNKRRHSSILSFSGSVGSCGCIIDNNNIHSRYEVKYENQVYRKRTLAIDGWKKPFRQTDPPEWSDKSGRLHTESDYGLSWHRGEFEHASGLVQESDEDGGWLYASNFSGPWSSVPGDFGGDTLRRRKWIRRWVYIGAAGTCNQGEENDALVIPWSDTQDKNKRKSLGSAVLDAVDRHRAQSADLPQNHNTSTISRRKSAPNCKISDTLQALAENPQPDTAEGDDCEQCIKLQQELDKMEKKYEHQILTLETEIDAIKTVCDGQKDKMRRLSVGVRRTNTQMAMAIHGSA